MGEKKEWRQWTDKDYHRFRKGKPGDRIQLPLLFITFALFMITLTMGIMGYSGNGSRSFQLAFYALLAISSVSLILLLIPKFFSKKEIRLLNRKLYDETYGTYPKVSFPIRKTFLVDEGIENQSIEQLSQDARFTYDDIEIALYGIDRCVERDFALDRDYSKEIVKEGEDSPKLGYEDVRRFFPIPFKGTLMVLKKNGWDFSSGVEIRQTKDSISPSFTHTEEDLIEGMDDLKEFDVYAKDKERAKRILTAEVQKEIVNLAIRFNKGIVVMFKGNQIDVELYDFKLDCHPIHYKDTHPMDSLERKKRCLLSLKSISDTFLSLDFSHND